MEFAALAEFNPGGADGGEQSGGKLARVERVLGEAAGSSILEILQCGVGVEGTAMPESCSMLARKAG